jgi:hypothetical protein
MPQGATRESVRGRGIALCDSVRLAHCMAESQKHAARPKAPGAFRLRNASRTPNGSHPMYVLT